MQADCPGLRVIYISGYHEDACIHASSLKPSESLLMKPFTTEQLIFAVRQLLDAGLAPDAVLPLASVPGRGEAGESV